MNPDPSREPSADLRVAAKAVRDLYLALCSEGFTSHEALVIVGQVIASNRGDQS